MNSVLGPVEGLPTYAYRIINEDNPEPGYLRVLLVKIMGEKVRTPGTDWPRHVLIRRKKKEERRLFYHYIAPIVSSVKEGTSPSHYAGVHSSFQVYSDWESTFCFSIPEARERLRSHLERARSRQAGRVDDLRASLRSAEDAVRKAKEDLEKETERLRVLNHAFPTLPDLVDGASLEAQLKETEGT